MQTVQERLEEINRMSSFEKEREEQKKWGNLPLLLSHVRNFYWSERNLPRQLYRQMKQWATRNSYIGERMTSGKKHRIVFDFTHTASTDGKSVILPMYIFDERFFSFIGIHNNLSQVYSAITYYNGMIAHERSHIADTFIKSKKTGEMFGYLESMTKIVKDEKELKSLLLKTIWNLTEDMFVDFKESRDYPFTYEFTMNLLNIFFFRLDGLQPAVQGFDEEPSLEAALNVLQYVRNEKYWYSNVFPEWLWEVRSLMLKPIEERIIDPHIRAEISYEAYLKFKELLQEYYDDNEVCDMAKEDPDSEKKKKENQEEKSDEEQNDNGNQDEGDSQDDSENEEQQENQQENQNEDGQKGKQIKQVNNEEQFVEDQINSTGNELSEEMMQAIRDYYDSLSEEEKEKLLEDAKNMMKEIESRLTQDFSRKTSHNNTPIIIKEALPPAKVTVERGCGLAVIDILHLEPVSDNTVEYVKDFANFNKFLKRARIRKQKRMQISDSGYELVEDELYRVATTGDILGIVKSIRRAKGEPEIIMLVDVSGSTSARDSNNHNKTVFDRQMEAAMGCSRDMVDVNMKHAVYTHTSGDGCRSFGYDHDYGCHVYGIFSHGMKFMDSKQPVTHGREHHQFRFNASYNIGRGGNYDGIALRYVATQFSQKPGAKIILYFSDGAPSDAPSGENPFDFTVETVEFLKKKGITVISMSVVEQVVESNNLIYGKDYNVDASRNIFTEAKKIIGLIAAASRG